MKSFLLGSLHLVLLHHFRQRKMLSVYQLLFFSSFVFIKVNNMYIIYHLYHFKCQVQCNKYIYIIFSIYLPTCLSSSQSLVTTNLICILLICKSFREHVIFVFLCLAYFAWHNASSSIHITINNRISLFLWLNNFLLCIFTTFSLFICWWALKLILY